MTMVFNTVNSECFLEGLSVIFVFLNSFLKNLEIFKLETPKTFAINHILSNPLKCFFVIKK